MPRPLIAVSGRPRRAGDVKNWPSTSATVAQMTYIEAVWQAGGDPAILAPRPLDDDHADALLRRFDGLVLVGGGDIDPAEYGQERSPRVYGIEPASDALELALARAALRLGTPTLAICRGLQVLNVALGGTLHQHITDDAEGHGDTSGPGTHHVEVEPGSRLAKALGGATRVDAAWSYHHQAIDALAPGLAVTGRAADGVIEAVEVDTVDRWCLAVQWHPERTAPTDPQQQALFNALTAAVLERPDL